jgi:NTP pyrophosphatase (non-canonical NTP hydrolase)
MYITVIILAFFLGGYVAKSIETMTPKKMEKIERDKNEIKR